MLRVLVAAMCVCTTLTVIDCQSQSETRSSQVYDRPIYRPAEEDVESQMYRKGQESEYGLPDGLMDGLGDFSDEGDGNGIQKRLGRLSLNHDLKTLARLLENSQSRRTSAARQRLRTIGKRSSMMPMLFPQFMRAYYSHRYPIVQLPDEGSKRGSRRLSVSGALSAIADMMEDQSRRRMREEIAVNRASLSGIGKRSSNERQYLSTSFEDTENGESD